jgi:hypothetical protein
MITAEGRDACGEPVVPVPLDHRAAEVAKARERLGPLRADRDVPEADELVDLVSLQLGEGGLERDQVAVQVGDQPDTQDAELI